MPHLPVLWLSQGLHRSCPGWTDRQSSPALLTPAFSSGLQFYSSQSSFQANQEH